MPNYCLQDGDIGGVGVIFKMSYLITENPGTLNCLILMRLKSVCGSTFDPSVLKRLFTKISH